MVNRPLFGASIQASNKSQPLQIGRTVSPQEGPRYYADIFDFSVNTTINKQYNLKDLGMSLLQCMYIDNSFNNEYVIFELNGFNISCPPQETLYTPVINSGFAISMTGYSTGAFQVQIALINILIPAYQSLPSAAQGSAPITGQNVNVANTPLPVNIVAQTEGSVIVHPDGPVAVTGAFFQATQPVSGSVTAMGASSSGLGITAATLLKAGAGTLYSCNVCVAGTGGGTINDAGSLGAVATANLLAMVPMNPAQPLIWPEGFPFSNGLVVTPGAGQQLAVGFR